MTEEMNLETLAQGAYSGLQGRNRLEFVIKTQQEWSDFYRVLTNRNHPQPPTPSVDFDKYTIVAAFMGEKNNGGYTTEITKVVKDGTGARIYVQESSPAGGRSTMALTQPYHVVKVPKLSGKVGFNYL